MGNDIITTLALVAGLALLVRAWGWRLGGLKGWLTVPLLALAFWKLLPGGELLPAVLLAVSIYVWRDLPRNTLGMALAPENNRVPESLGFNMVFLAPAFLTLALGYDVAQPLAGLALVAVSVACTALAYLHHRLEPYAARTCRDVNAFIEAGCGAALGLAIALIA